MCLKWRAILRLSVPYFSVFVKGIIMKFDPIVARDGKGTKSYQDISEFCFYDVMITYFLAGSVEI